jgi:hypothetical protein
MSCVGDCSQLLTCWVCWLLGIGFRRADLLVVDVQPLQVRCETFIPWRQPRLRMLRRSGSRLKRVRSPPRDRGLESSDRGGEETATDMEMYERRSKHRQDTRLRSRVSK